MPLIVMLPQKEKLSGRDYGFYARHLLHLDELDNNSNSEIDILFSVATASIDPAFIVGCFLDSMDHLGKFRFEEKYKFFPDERDFSCAIDEGISQCERILHLKGR